MTYRLITNKKKEELWVTFLKKKEYSGVNVFVISFYNKCYTMRVIKLIICLCFFTNIGFSQSITTQSFTVGGDFDKFYPVIFSDGSWSHGATELEISRSGVHTNTSWRGSLISKFRFHTTRWGHLSNFIDVDIRHNVRPFIADWRDATGANSSRDVIIWLRGGGTTYYFRSSNSNIPAPRIYDDVQNALPFQEQNGPTHSYTTSINPKLNQNGKTFSHEAYFTGGGESYFAGSLKIGQDESTGEKLRVNGDAAIDGTIRAREIKVDVDVWADFVFEEDYQLKPLDEVEKYIEENKHLPDMPSINEVKEKGISVAIMDAKLLQKVEELTLYTLEQEKKLKELDALKEEIRLIKNMLLNKNK